MKIAPLGHGLPRIPPHRRTLISSASCCAASTRCSLESPLCASRHSSSTCQHGGGRWCRRRAAGRGPEGASEAAARPRCVQHTSTPCTPCASPQPSAHQGQQVVQRGVDQGEAEAELALALLVGAVHVVRPHVHPLAGRNLKLVLPVRRRLLQPAGRQARRRHTWVLVAGFTPALRRCSHPPGIRRCSRTHASMAEVAAKGTRKMGWCTSRGTKNSEQLQTLRLPTTLQCGAGTGALMRRRGGSTSQ